MSAQSGRRVLINTTSLTGASLWRIATSFVTQVMVARLLSAAAFGDFAVTLAWLHIGQIITEAGLPAWMVRELAGKSQDRRAIWRHVLGIQVVLALLSAIVLLVIAWLLPSYMPPLPLIALAVTSLPFYAVMSATLALFESAESHHLVFVVDVTVNALLFITTVILLLLGYGLAAIFAALALVQIFSSLFSLWILRWSRLLADSPTGVTRDTPPTWRTTLRASASYFTLAFTDVLQQRADLLLLGAVLSPTATGLYAAASSIVRVAIKLIQAYWRALLPTLSRQHEESSAGSASVGSASAGYGTLAEIALRYGGFLVCGATVALSLLAPWIVPLLFGNEFAEASVLLQAMVWSAPFYLWEGYAITLLLVVRRARRAAGVTIAHLLLLVGAMAALVWLWGALGGAIANVVAAALAALYAAWLLHKGNQTLSPGVLVRLIVACGLALGAGWIGQQAMIASGWDDEAAVFVSTLCAIVVFVGSAFVTRLLGAKDASRMRRILARNA